MVNKITLGKKMETVRCIGCMELFEKDSIAAHRKEKNGIIESCLSKSGLVKNGYRLNSIVGQAQGYWERK